VDFRNLDVKEKQEVLKDTINRFDLKPLSFEGGYFNETFRSISWVIDNKKENSLDDFSPRQGRRVIRNISYDDPLQSVEPGYLCRSKADTKGNQQTYPAEETEKSFPCRSLCTCIYYLITPESFSKLHRLPGEEIFHFYFGDPVKMLNICESGKAEVITLGNDFKNGEIPQYVVGGNCWQGAFLGESLNPVFALLGTTMSPGFDINDYEKADNFRDELVKKYPEFSEIIKKMV